MSTARSRITSANGQLEVFLDVIGGIENTEQLETYLSRLRDQLREECSCPEKLEFLGLEEIPSYLYSNLYPVIAEAVTNSARHGSAHQVSITAHNHNGMLGILIEDNGEGFDQLEVKYGQGISNMKNYVRRIGGQLDIDSNEHAGTRVLINISIPVAVDRRLQE